MFGLDPDKKTRSIAVDRTGALLTGGSVENNVSYPPTLAPPISTELLTQTLSGWYDATGMNSVSFTITTGPGITAGQITFEQTDDPTLSPNGTPWLLMDVTDTTLNRATGTGNLAASTTKQWAGPVLCRYVRLRVTVAVVGGTVGMASAFSAAPFGDIGPQRIQGTVADNGGAPQPIQIGGLAVNANPSAATSGRIRSLLSTLVGALIVRPYSIPEADWSYTGTLNSTTAAAAKAAGAAGIRNYVTAMQYQNTNATATTITVLDGATVLLTLNAPANMALPAVVCFPTPLRGTAATALNVNCGTAGAAVLMNVQGYQAP